jgi:hypothetical protein
VHRILGLAGSYRSLLNPSQTSTIIAYPVHSRSSVDPAGQCTHRPTANAYLGRLVAKKAGPAGNRAATGLETRMLADFSVTVAPFGVPRSAELIGFANMNAQFGKKLMRIMIAERM